MPSPGLILILCQILLATSFMAQDAEPVPVAPAEPAQATTEKPEKDARPERVHLIVDRYTEVGGVIEEEDKNLLTIRDPKGKLHSYPKSRLIRIIRLLDVDKPRIGIVELRDGDVLRGMIIRDDYDEVVIEIEGVWAKLPRASVVMAKFDLTLEEKHQRFKSMIDPSQHLRRFELANWLFEEEAYELAKEELQSLIDDSQMPEAISLLKFVDAQMILNRKKAETEAAENRAAEENAGSRGDKSTGTVDLKDMLPSEYISSQDVNLVRVYEINFDQPPKVFLSPESIRAILENYGDSKLIPSDSVGRTRLFRADPIEIVQLLFDLKARDLYSSIEVQTEPYALNLFRQRVHDAWLIPNCATSRCHGGLDGGRFFLHRRNAKNERVRTTNFLILDRWNLGERPLINYDEPAESLIIQYGLPRNEARYPHPDVKGWRPAFNRANQRLLKDAVKWIEAMYKPRPRYPVSYNPPILDSPDEPDIPVLEDQERRAR